MTDPTPAKPKAAVDCRFCGYEKPLVSAMESPATSRWAVADGGAAVRDERRARVLNRPPSTQDRIDLGSLAPESVNLRFFIAIQSRPCLHPIR
jgi:hypothetical protein